MPIINTGQNFKTLKKEIINVVDDKGKKTPLTLGQVLADVALTPHKTKNGFRPLRGYELAQKLYSNKEIEIDTSDFIQLKELTEASEGYATIIIAQALQMLEGAKK